MRVLLLERRKKLSSLILVASAWHWDKIFFWTEKDIMLIYVQYGMILLSCLQFNLLIISQER